MSTQTPSFTTPPSVAAQIARLPDMPMAEIRALWQKLVGGDTPTHNRQFLERRIAYRLQELEFRKVDADLLDRNQRRIESLVETGKVKNATVITVQPQAPCWSANTKASSTA